MKFLRLFNLTVFSIILLLSPLSGAEMEETFISPTKRFNATHDLFNIFSKFKSYGATSTHFTLFSQLIEKEDTTFFGYHGARREFRIYQDIIRIAIEELLEIPIRPDFHFFRIPGDPKQDIGSAKQFLINHNYDVFDDNPLEAQQLLSINMALYEYYWNDNNCSVYFFVNDANWHFHSYENLIRPFFILLGIDPNYIHEAFEIGRNTLNGSAVLMQLFDGSGYQFLNDQAYLSHMSGRVYQTDDTPSEVILDNEKSSFPQLRLMMDNQYSLNPFSYLIVKRYDLNDTETVNDFEQKLRHYLKTLPIDASQKEIYREQLLHMWNVN